jgi:hypothetical protein
LVAALAGRGLEADLDGIAVREGCGEAGARAGAQSRTAREIDLVVDLPELTRGVDEVAMTERGDFDGRRGAP